MSRPDRVARSLVRAGLGVSKRVMRFADSPMRYIAYLVREYTALSFMSFGRL
jgi:hypothetical protein